MKPKNHGKPWTKAQLWRLADMYVNNQSWVNMANLLGRSATACYARMTIIKCAFTMYDDQHKAEKVAGMR